MDKYAVIVDLGTSGAIPVPCTLSTDNNNCVVKVTMERIDLEVWIHLKDLSELLAEVLDGNKSG